MLPGENGTLSLQDAPSLSAGILVVALQANPTPYAGGSLIAIPFVATIPLSTDIHGQWEATLPGGLGPASLFLQCVLPEPGTGPGVTLSNGIQLTWP